jgi:hypothetical protein
MRALSIRQPWAELILRGVKTVEYRSRPTRIIGERFWIYASKGSGFRVQGLKKDKAAGVWSRDLAGPGGGPPRWMLELAEELILRGGLPTGVIVGSAVIEKVTGGDGAYEWHLAGVERTDRPRKPDGHPQPVWFRPFGAGENRAAEN